MDLENNDKVGLPHDALAAHIPQLCYVGVAKRWKTLGPIAASAYARDIWLADMRVYEAQGQPAIRAKPNYLFPTRGALGKEETGGGKGSPV